MNLFVRLIKLTELCLPGMPAAQRDLALAAIEETRRLDADLQERKWPAPVFYKRFAWILLVLDAAGVPQRLLERLDEADLPIVVDGPGD
jgi:hypothetical protein